jgi:integrase
MFQKPGTRLFTIQYYANGKRIRESTGTANRNAAVKLLNQRLAAVAQGSLSGPEADRTTFADIARMLTNDYRANGLRSIKRIEQAITHLRSFFTDARRAKTITTDAITAYVSHRKQEKHRQGPGASNATINRELAALRRMLNLAARSGKITVKPNISLLRESNARKGFFEPAEFGELLDELPAHLKPLAQAGYITGWRVSELLSRTWKNVDLDAGWLRLEPGESKNERGRLFPLTPDLRRVLEGQVTSAYRIEELTGSPVKHVFHHADGSPIKNYIGAWRAACGRAGLSEKLFHDFRRTAVRNLERAGVPRSAAMQMTGHLTEAIFRRYAIVDQGMMLEAATKLQMHHDKEGHTPHDARRNLTPSEKGQGG